jgi:hypothetical protein
VPTGLRSGGSANAGFQFGGTALGFNPARNSLYITGHDWDQLTAEISIPALDGTATLLQPLVDATEGKANSVNPSSPNQKKIGGTLVSGSNLIVSVFDYYDGAGTQTLTHFIRPLNLSTRGQVTGPYRVGPLGGGFYSGYMGEIPAAWQGPLGGKALTGNANIPITGRTSLGPAAAAFDPANMNASGARALVYYPLDHPTLGVWDQANPLYSGTDSMKGVVFPAGTNSVLFFGRHGTTFCYGPGTADPSLAGKPSPSGDRWCYDPEAVDSKGTHGYPYLPQVWAYDANDLATVRAGQKQPWEVKPYAVWRLAGVNGYQLGGAAYDPATGRIYVSEMFGNGENPLIHVFNVSGAAAAVPPKPPTNVRIQ